MHRQENTNFWRLEIGASFHPTSPHDELPQHRRIEIIFITMFYHIVIIGNIFLHFLIVVFEVSNLGKKKRLV